VVDQNDQAFDIADIPYPWAPGEAPMIDPVAIQLRDRQRQFGPDAIRGPILDLIADTRGVLDQVTLARKLNVPPDRIEALLLILRAEDRHALLNADPADDAAEHVAMLNQVIRSCRRLLANPALPHRDRADAENRLMKALDQRHKYRSALGLIKPLPVPKDRATEPADEIQEGLAALFRDCALLDELPVSHTGPAGNGTGTQAAQEPQSERYTDDPFDLIGMRFPWSPGEAPNPDPVAVQLRLQQRQFGTQAIRASVLDLVADFARIMDHVTVARKLDVPPAMIGAWLTIKKAEDKAALLSLDPAANVAEQLATLDQIKKAALRTLAIARTPAPDRAKATDTLLKVEAQIHRLKTDYGLVRPIHTKDPHPDKATALAEEVSRAMAQILLDYEVIDGAPSEPELVDEEDRALGAELAELVE
jgi:hypothetical protein